ncbi:MAG: two-component regulator propeller domain-containing protein [Ginsengibacter sp.]
MWSFCLKNILLFLPIWFLTGIRAYSQSAGQVLIQKIDEENGLSDNHVQCIYKDTNGFMWIGTASGLDLLDGSSITIFKNIPEDNHSISSNSISDITEDSSGLLWIGTHQGLNSFVPALRKFTTIPLHKDHNTKNDFIISLAVDKNNNLFIATSSGLFFYDKKSQRISFDEIPGDNYEKILNNNITHIAFDKTGLLWLSTYNGLWSYNENSHQFIHKINKENDPDFTRLFTNFIINHSGKLWIGTWDKGLKEFDPVSQKIVSHSPPGGKDINIHSITEAHQYDGSSLILFNSISTGFDIQKDKFITISGFSKAYDKTSVETLYSSNNNWVWMGTHEGLYFYNPSKNLIRNHLFKKPITGQGVSLFEWRNKILVSGSGENFLKAYDENLNETGHYGDQFAKEGISCLSIQGSGNDKLRCGTSSGIADINLLTHAIDFQPLQKEPTNPSTINFITYLLKDSNQNWWFFPWRNGIWFTDSSIQKSRQLFKNFITDYNVPKPLVISDACEDKNNNIWMGDYDEGVIFYNSHTNHFSKPFIKYLGERNDISQILYYHDTCYSFTGTTLLMWNVDNPVLQTIRLSPQIDKFITDIALDSADHLWIATQNGLLSYNFTTKIYSRFTIADGLPSNEMNGTLCCLKNGTMIFGSPDFLSSFRPEKLLESIDNKPGIKLSEVIVDDNPFPFVLSKNNNFNHNVHNFIFKWAITDYNNPLSNRYYYQLEGIDKSWHFSGKSGEVEFANLSPGDYTLLLKGENSNGISSGKILNLQFKIALPFWRTWWFLTLLLGYIAAVFYFLYRYRVNQFLKIEKLRNKISLDLHDDIGSTLSSISILSDMALRRKEEPEAEDMLREIKDNSISMMEKMDDIVWSINPKNDSLESLFLRIRSFAAKLFEAKGINYTINIGENIQHIHVLMEYRRHIYLIMKEAINNLVKYSECTEAQIHVSHHTPLLTIIIKDNGKGYDAGHAIHGNGLAGMKKRAKEMNAEIKIEPKINEGTVITLFVKIK